MCTTYNVHLIYVVEMLNNTHTHDGLVKHNTYERMIHNNIMYFLLLYIMHERVCVRDVFFRKDGRKK